MRMSPKRGGSQSASTSIRWMELTAAGSGSGISRIAVSENRSGSTTSAPHGDDFQDRRCNDDRPRIAFAALDCPGDFPAVLGWDFADINEPPQAGANERARPLPLEVGR